MEQHASTSYYGHFVRAKDDDDVRRKGNEDNNDNGLSIRKFYEEITKDSKQTIRSQGKISTRKFRRHTDGTLTQTESEKTETARCQQKRKKHKHKQNERAINKLFMLIHEGDLASFKEFYESGDFSIDMRDQYNWTPLMCSTASGNVEIVRYLLDHGASVYSPIDSAGMSAWDIAVKFDNTVIIDIFFQMRVKKEKLSPKEISNEEDNKELCNVCSVEYDIDETDKHISSTPHLFQEYKDKNPLTYYHLSNNNIGYKILKETGWSEERGLGPEGKGVKNPIATVLKRDRGGLGLRTHHKKKVTHFKAHDDDAIKQPKMEKVERVQKRFKKKENEITKRKSQGWEMQLREYMNRE